MPEPTCLLPGASVLPLEDSTLQLGRDKARCLAVRCLIPPVEHRACGRVGRQRVALSGTFPAAPLRTDRDSFDVNQLSS
jgi:hypothetical protein